MQATCKNRDPVSNGFRRWPTRPEYYSQYIRSHRTNSRVLPDSASCTPAQRILRTYHQIFTLLSSCMLVLSHASDLPEECCILHKPRSTQPQAQMWLSMTASVAEASSPARLGGSKASTGGLSKRRTGAAIPFFSGTLHV